MTLLGRAAVAMWWDMVPEDQNEFEHWHSHEHFPERMGIPGFLRGSRWKCLDEEMLFFVLYELEAYEVLTSDAYRVRLNNPTPWSVKMMPKHRNMVRSQCRIEMSAGRGIAGYTATIRLSPAPSGEAELNRYLRAIAVDVPDRPGLAGFHLLVTDTPDAAPTAEQRIRGGDREADWIFRADGYEEAALRRLLEGALCEDCLLGAGAAAGPDRHVFRLCHSVGR